jgi:hypothetical protein
MYADADLAEAAAVLTIRLAQEHAFVDNNKRLAYMAGVLFLRENGHPMPAEVTLVFAKKIVAAVEHGSPLPGWPRGARDGREPDLSAWSEQPSNILAGIDLPARSAPAVTPCSKPSPQPACGRRLTAVRPEVPRP